MHSWHIYILHCADDSYYTGMTSNLPERVHQHEEGLLYDAYTYSRRPVRLVWTEGFATEAQAMERERQLKGWSRAKKEALMAGNIEQLKLLAKKKWK